MINFQYQIFDKVAFKIRLSYVISGAIIHHGQLPIGAGLRQRGIHGLGNQGGAVVYGNDDGNQRNTHRINIFSTLFHISRLFCF